MFLYTMMWMLVHPTHLVLLCAPPSNEILCGSLSLVEIMLLCVCVCVCVCVQQQLNEFNSSTTGTEKW